MLDLDDHWVWDFWVAREGSLFHCFFLKAPRRLGDPELRHRNASVGHAVSKDLRSWTRLADALDPQAPPAFDDLATWTGSAVRSDDGEWHMFTTGLSLAEHGLVQRIGVATSPDLTAWRRSPEPVLEADPRWYAVRGAGVPETHWRDPWVVQDDRGLWHLLATARASAATDAAVAHATSVDLRTWEAGPPIAASRGRFGWAEVVSVECVEGRWVLLFSCLSEQMPGAPMGAGGVWTLPVEPPSTWGSEACLDLDAAVRLTTEELYVGKLLRLPDGAWQCLAFRHTDRDGAFRGGLIDPVAVSWRADGKGLRLEGAPAEWVPPEGEAP